MRKFSAISIALLLVIFAGISCGKKAEAPKAGSASPDDLLKLLPVNAKGVFFMNINQAMSIEAVDKAITTSKDYKKFQEFVETTQLDPRKDVYFAVLAMTGDLGKKEEKGVAIINLKYDQDKILTLIKQKMKEEADVQEDVEEKEAAELIEEQYNGKTIYQIDEDDQKVAFSFLDASNIILGSDAEVKTVIDIHQKKADNIFKNEALTKLLAQTSKESMFWGAIIIPSEAVSEATSGNPMLSNLEGLKAATIAFDYKNSSIIAEIKLLSGDAEKNQQIAKMLDGLKAMGGMLAAEKPEIGELLGKIEISSSPEFVKLFANIPEELLAKLKTAVPTAAEPEE
ncbi:MAG: hypothetical protein JXB23_01255 [Candidatus Aminicenantes bacterium]|nr:hypothetical protein [Candidatus Aminicenantes bacterium]